MYLKIFKMSIEVKNVTKLYGKQKALDDVSFSINTGEIVGFIGPNGAGKSTMMKILTGIIPQTSGEAYINNINVIENSMAIREKLDICLKIILNMKICMWLSIWSFWQAFILLRIIRNVSMQLSNK